MIKNHKNERVINTNKAYVDSTNRNDNDNIVVKHARTWL